MLTLDEIIKHVEYVAYNNNDKTLVCLGIKEYRKLAELLRELQELRKQPEIIYCKDCDNLKSDEYHHWCKSHGGFFNPEKDFCSRAERRGME